MWCCHRIFITWRMEMFTDGEVVLSPPVVLGLIVWLWECSWIENKRIDPYYALCLNLPHILDRLCCHIPLTQSIFSHNVSVPTVCNSYWFSHMGVRWNLLMLGVTQWSALSEDFSICFRLDLVMFICYTC